MPALTFWSIERALESDAIAVLDSNTRAAALGPIVPEGDTFGEDQLRTTLGHGAKSIEDASGTPENTAPRLANLHGDRATVSAGGTVFIDAGRDATVADEDGNLWNVSVRLSQDATGSGRLDIDTTGNVRIDGLHVYVGATLIGTLRNKHTHTIAIDFASGAPVELVQELIRALTYTDETAPGAPVTARQVTITLWDHAGASAVATVDLAPEGTDPVNGKPSQVLLSATSVDELAAKGTLVGTLSATDPDANDSFTFSLVDDAGGRFAVEGDHLVVADGVRLDHEQGASHRVTMRVTDKGGLTHEESFIITVGDVRTEIAVGSARVDILVAGSGHDRLNGKGGRDILTGGKGKDVFVFDQKVDLRGTHRDKVTDFRSKDDAIWLENGIFRKLGKKGSEKKPAKLKSEFFTIGAKAKEMDDYVVYNKKTGVLSYDADGAGRAAAYTIATFKKGTTIKADDFFVV